jgi:hypothetical protein
MSIDNRLVTRTLAPAALAAALAVMSGCATTGSGGDTSAAGPADATLSADGLQLVDKTRTGEIYADPAIDWSGYDSIVLDPATVAFRKNWERDQNRNLGTRIRPEDMEQIKSGLAGLFDEVFTTELSSNGGYEMTSTPGENVLRITPHIVDLDVYAPDAGTVGRTYQYSESAGRMTLKLEIHDSVTGDLIAMASDRQEDPRLGWMQWRTRASNRADAERMLKRWAIRLRERLDEAREAGNGQG